MIYFTSDLHLSKGYSIQEYDQVRIQVDATSEKIKKIWNDTIKKDDHVYVLGDFGSYRLKSDVESVLKELNGRKHLIIGNNDNEVIMKAEGWVTVSELKDLRVRYTAKDGAVRFQNIVLCHYAMKVWKNSGKGSWQLYGHSHGSLPDDDSAFQMDIGIEANDFKILSFFDVKTIMEKKYYLPKDYHGYAGVSTIPEHMPKKYNYVSNLNYNWSFRDYNCDRYSDGEESLDRIFAEGK